MGRVDRKVPTNVTVCKRKTAIERFATSPHNLLSKRKVKRKIKEIDCKYYQNRGDMMIR